MSAQPKRSKARAAVYAAIVPALSRAARVHGYALAVHGSMTRDLDVVAIPWTLKAGSRDVLIDALAKTVGGARGEMTAKPHGRVGVVVYFGSGTYLDLSIMPRSGDGGAK